MGHSSEDDTTRPEAEGSREHLGDTVGIHLRALASDGPRSARRRGKQLSDDAERESGWPAIVVLRDPVSQHAVVCALSAEADRSLAGKIIAPMSAAGRASMSNAAIPGQTCADLLGPRRARHQGASGGLAIPLRHGAYGVGALVVFGPFQPGDKAVTRLTKMAGLAGRDIARALRRQRGDCQATTDPLTGLPNGGGFYNEVTKVATDGVLFQFDVQSRQSAAETLGSPATSLGERRLGCTLQEAVRNSDVLARFTPGIFVAWLRYLGRRDLESVKQRLTDVVTTPTWWAPDCAVTVAGIGQGHDVAAQLTSDH